MSSRDSIECEIWKPVLGYEGYYEVSSIGRVRSVPRRLRTFRGSRLAKGTMLALGKHKQGYLIVRLNRKHRCVHRLVHRLVVEAFIRRIERGKEVNHLNGDKRDNRPENLEIVSRQQNIDHAVATGLMNCRGERHPFAKLTVADVLAIRSMASDGKPYKELGKQFHVWPTTIRSIVARQRWRHI